MIWQIPTIEEIYNEYHKQTFYYMNGVYPKTIKTFKALQNQNKVEYLKRFQQMIKRNRESLDWKLYIKAIASIMKNRFDLKILGSLAGTKLYRDYVKCLYQSKNSEEEIYNDIIKSLTFINEYIKYNQISFNQYFEIDKDIIPLSIKHIYSGTISLYFYACFSSDILAILLNYPDDIFQEYFQLNKYEFIQTYILNKRIEIMKYPKILKLIEKFEEIYKK